ncbi:MAG TPA: TerB family tellurite resistance protein [Stellaceae bacterium]|jgi:DnaJ like chaperone protein|nr:TerB family tellurite resistance protein [Stellaceae bacterium]
MNVIGRIINGARELSFGGPLGALLRRTARHLPRRLARHFGGIRSPSAADSVAFTIAVIALGAKMAKADGVVSRDEVAAFREVFRVPPGEEAHLRVVFDLARKSTAGFDSYARQVGRLFAGQRGVLEDLLGGLFYIALADGRLCAAEEAYLREVARHLGIDAVDYARIRSAYAGALPERGDDDPHAVLGIATDASLTEIRGAYRRLVRAHHPDLAQAQGLPPERVALATARIARINAARDRLLNNRGMHQSATGRPDAAAAAENRKPPETREPEVQTA